MTSLLDQLLIPQRVALRALEDLHRIAHAAVAMGSLADRATSLVEPMADRMTDTAQTLRSLRDEAVGIRTTIEPMGKDLRILRDDFGRANDEIARLREAFGPQLEGLRSSAEAMRHELRQVRELFAAVETDIDGIGERVTGEIEALRQAVRALVRDADEISNVVEPLQAATDRVGKVADRLPGGGE